MYNKQKPCCKILRLLNYLFLFTFDNVVRVQLLLLLVLSRAFDTGLIILLEILQRSSDHWFT